MSVYIVGTTCNVYKDTCPDKHQARA